MAWHLRQTSPPGTAIPREVSRARANPRPSAPRHRSSLGRVRFGLCVANIGTYSDPRATVQVARAAEAAGWETLFVWDHLGFVWGAPAADPWVTLAAVATSTARIRIGTAVTPVARRRPHVLAQTVATLDVLSGGRVIFGAGLGGAPSEFARFGEPQDARIRAEMLDEGLELLTRFWTGEEVHHRGKYYTVDGVRLAPLPLQERVPTWIGGNLGPSLRRAARWDGWLADSIVAMTLTPDDVAARIGRILRERCIEEPFDVAVLGESDKGDAASYGAAGATWWLENLHDRRGSPEQMLDLVNAGPPS
jgi:alkanesulfonate monooxygenase SsuD/methylene tetrahydromethanopterin reductase-like flavin-dependent oxidoreductase (luciferase family)